MKSGEQGKRSDLQVVTEKILAKVPFQQIAEEHATTFVRYSRGLRDLSNTVVGASRPNTWSTPGRYLWLWGPTGSGKTSSVFSKYPDGSVFVKSGGKWFDGFDPTQHRAILIDDYRLTRDSLQLDDLLRIAQPFSCQVEIKGGYVKIGDQDIIVTSNLPPESIFKPDECPPLLRRFHVKKLIKSETVVMDETNDSPPGFIDLSRDD